MMKKHNSLDRVTKIVRSMGCTATTTKGIIRFIKKNGLKAVKEEYKPRIKFKSFPIMDTTLGDGALNICQERNPRLKNWNSAEAVVDEKLHNKMESINEGRYSSRCTYIKYSYTPQYHSELRVARSSKKVAFLWQSGKLIRTLFAPSGLMWGWDESGVYLQSKDKTEYHPSSDDLKRKDFARHIREMLSITRVNRKQIKVTEKQKVEQEKIYNRLKNKVRVTLNDARSVGNCLEGIVGYMSGLGYDRRFITSPWANVPGKLLDDTNLNVKRAIELAIERECLMSI